ncbi:MAG: tyrosine-type recombinase/integrase, partial [Kordiimonas sp.]
ERRELDWRNLDDSKRRKGRAVVPINDNLYDALIEAQELAETDHVIEWAGRPVKNIRKPLERMKSEDEAGIYVTAHMFRHSAAVWMAQDNIPIQKIAEYLGHSDISVTYKHYARYYPDHLRDAADVLTW